MAPHRPRVLVAGTREAIELLALAVERDAELVHALSVEEALQRLDPAIELVVCDVRFDSSRMFDFLGALKNGDYRDLPVVCFRAGRSVHPDSTQRAIELALGALGVNAFVDLPAVARARGLEGAVQDLREIVLGYLPPGNASGAREDPPAEDDDGPGAGKMRK